MWFADNLCGNFVLVCTVCMQIVDNLIAYTGQCVTKDYLKDR